MHCRPGLGPAAARGEGRRRRQHGSAGRPQQQLSFLLRCGLGLDVLGGVLHCMNWLHACQMAPSSSVSALFL